MQPPHAQCRCCLNVCIRAAALTKMMQALTANAYALLVKCAACLNVDTTWPVSNLCHACLDLSPTNTTSLMYGCEVLWRLQIVSAVDMATRALVTIKRTHLPPVLRGELRAGALLLQQGLCGAGCDALKACMCCVCIHSLTSRGNGHVVHCRCVPTHSLQAAQRCRYSAGGSDDAHGARLPTDAQLS